jgi:cytoskeletal protein RodZ
MLTMIEENQYDSLPAEVFLKSFLKSYAEILQIDSYRVVEGYLKSMKSAANPST